ncbi:hypothetical protein [Aldersonia kunmingensis]|nr:hypothetical protein [Aldersonia kunmingensis]
MLGSDTRGKIPQASVVTPVGAVAEHNNGASSAGLPIVVVTSA